ncbi:hypothetical protein [Microbacterium sp. NPDC056234]|uniref:COG4315 family predicted lipoprotein n=1 Tax=Microbacterium sp. NPDC056234 TaxID=3345757 RepID=UPI0035D8B43A
MNAPLAARLGAVAVILTLGLAGCSSGSGTGEDPYSGGSGGESSAPAEEPAETADVSLMTADSSLGSIVVDGEGMTVYMFDKDTQGADASTCEGECADNWPAVTVDSETPEVEGVTGEVGTITGVDGETQLTLNGWPLYYFVGDAAPGEVKGQGVNDVWWVLTPDGERMAG